MNPGTLDRSIQIQRQADGLFLVDSLGNYITDSEGEKITTTSRRGRFGAEQDAWGLWHTRRARRLQKSGSESSENGREIGRQVVIFRIRYTAGIMLTDRVFELADQLAYDIIDIKEIGRRELQDLTCVLHSNARPV
jgi:head-tail adaptor